MGWDSLSLGDIPYWKSDGVFGYSDSSADTQRVQPFAGQYVAAIFLIVVSCSTFYRGIAGRIFIIIWIGAGLLTFIIGKPGWHIGASGLIYGLAFFLFFSGILRKYVPLIAISLLVTFLYGGIIWHMFPYFSPANMSWEGHLSGGIMGTLCAFGFLNHGPQRPEPFADETDEEEESPEEDINDHNTTDSTDITS